jgi:hypothetical protein
VPPHFYPLSAVRSEQKHWSQMKGRELRRAIFMTIFMLISPWHSAPACGVLQHDPNKEDQDYNNRDLNFQLAGPFRALHFAFAFRKLFRD